MQLEREIVKRTRLDEDDDDGFVSGSPSHRFGMVWEITCDAWAFGSKEYYKSHKSHLRKGYDQKGVAEIPIMKKKHIPKFASEDEERDFWGKTDSTDYVDWGSAKRVVLQNLKPSQKKISLRLPAMMLAELKRLANKRSVPYQSLMKLFWAERLDEELRASKSRDGQV